MPVLAALSLPANDDLSLPANDASHSLGRGPKQPSSGASVHLSTRQSGRFGSSGDLFEIFDHGDGYISTVVVDVCGHGPAAAQVADRIRPFVLRCLARGGSPARLLAALNDGLISDGLLDRFVAAVAVRVDLDSGLAELACAGHLGPFVRRTSGRVQALNRAIGVPLGLLSGETYAEVSVQLDPHDILVVVTDGITDPLATADDPLGEASLLLRLADAPHATTGICQMLLPDGAPPTRDDATVLVLQIPARVVPLPAREPRLAQSCQRTVDSEPLSPLRKPVTLSLTELVASQG